MKPVQRLFLWCFCCQAAFHHWDQTWRTSCAAVSPRRDRKRGSRTGGYAKLGDPGSVCTDTDEVVWKVPGSPGL